ncbi:MAG: hypothetical protein IKX57_00325, partial [Oscillospiraceae bacterium]|nr:hypothetical protein [Oscillospiraceae bacterium]
MKLLQKAAAVLCGCLLTTLTVPAVPASAEAAPEFTRIAKYTASTGYNTGVLTDNNENTAYNFPAGGTLTITTEDPICGISVKFNRQAVPWRACAG